MPKKSTTTKAKSKTTNPKSSKCTCPHCCSKSVLLRPSTWVVALLALGVVVIGALGALSLASYEGKIKTDMEIAELSVFDSLASDFIRECSIVDGQPSVNEITGYGISDEDGVFYMTFDFTPYSQGEDGGLVPEDTRHGITYFWYDEERGTYGNAFSYPDDPSDHPAGPYVSIDVK